MARPKKQTVDYYPHSSTQGKAMFIIKSKYGNEGYAFFHQLCEVLCHTDGHVIDYGNPSDKEYLLAYCGVNEQSATEMLNTLSTLGKIDKDLWINGYIWYQNLVDSVRDAYKKRVDQFPHKPSLRSQKPNSTEFLPTEIPLEGSFRGVSTDGSTESKVKESKVKNNIAFGNPVTEINEFKQLKIPSDVNYSFDYFWLLYPKKIGKEESHKAFDDLVGSGIGIDDLCESVTIYKKNCEPNYYSRPEKYLTEGYWLKHLMKGKPTCPKCHGRGYTEQNNIMYECECIHRYDAMKEG